MDSWDSTKYSKWYNSHRRFSFTAHFCIEHYEEGKQIPDTIFKPFLKSLSCHSKSEEKMFQDIQPLKHIFQDHESIIVSKDYTNDEKYSFCKSLLSHMKEEEAIVYSLVLSTSSTGLSSFTIDNTSNTSYETVSSIRD